jgi:hypothetical protein
VSKYVYVDNFMHFCREPNDWLAAYSRCLNAQVMSSVILPTFMGFQLKTGSIHIKKLMISSL